MLKWKTVIALVFSVLAFGLLHAQQHSKSLTALDYAEIQQLYGRYAIGFDTGSGEMFAQAFTRDGVFQTPNATMEGYEKLAEFGSRPNATKGPTNVFHVVSNVTIAPSPEGATGTAYVLLVNLGKTGQASSLAGGGIYHDVFVKGPEGWRIKKRVYQPAHSVPPAKPVQ